MKILVGSENPVKINSVKDAFLKYFSDIEVLGVKVKSGVPDQPIGEQTFEGAKNRACALKEINEKEKLQADYFVGIEGGVMEQYSRWFGFGAMCIVDKTGKTGYGMSPHFELPESVMKKLLEGVELGTVMDELTETSNIKQREGAIGYFTKNKMTRQELYVPGLITALVPFLNQELFFNQEQS